MKQKERSAYSVAGVDIEAQNEGLREVKKLAKSTFTSGVLSDIGSFGALFRPEFGQLADPVLVASADGVGTKLSVAKLANDLTTVGRDLVNHCVNDILVQGAKPLFFLDYVGAGVLEPAKLVDLVRGVTDGCRANGCALIGGETAEMPGFYQAGDYELVGFIVGVVDRGAILDGTRVAAGDVLVGLPSAGMHTNGYTLARRIFFDEMGLKIRDRIPGTKSKLRVGEWLLQPHLSYLEPLSPLLGHPGLHALAHITGGGLTDNVPRILPAGLAAEIRVGSWEIPEPFRVLQDKGDVELEEMLRVFNMGIGMVAVVAPDALAEISRSLAQAGQRALPIGKVVPGDGRVVYDLGLLPNGEEAI
ncbi:MAG: phosphoribosylformylglycinamidine cyclo-ligase [Thermoanaerobaculia bacterium]